MTPMPSEAFARRHFIIEALQAVLAAQGRFGTPRQIAGGQLGHEEVLDRTELLDTLDHLHIDHHMAPLSPEMMQDMPMPCIVTSQTGAVFWVEQFHRDLGLRLKAIDDDKTRWIGIPDGPLEVLIIDGPSASAIDDSPTRRLADLVRPEIGPLLVNSAVVNLLGLATPFFVMAIYNTALPSQSVDVLISLGLGLALVYLFEFAIRAVRTGSLQRSSAALERGLILGLVGKLFALPMALLTRKDSASNMAHLTQFRAVKAMLQGPMVQPMLDLPFVVLFAVVLFALAPPIGWTVLSFAGLTVGMFFVFRPRRKAREARMQKAQASYQRLLSETVERQHDIRRLGLRDTWQRRIEASQEEMISTNYASLRFNQMVGLMMQSLVMTAGITSGFYATYLAIVSELSVGALIAILVLTWRFLTPIQSLSNASEQGMFALGSIKSFASLLSLPVDSERGIAHHPATSMSPAIQFEQVSVRFKDAVSPALLGVNLQAQKGDIIIVCGGTMAGKTCLAETLAGLWTPVAGRVMVGGVDTATSSRDCLREHVAFCPQEPELIGTSLRENFLLANPQLTQSQIWDVLTSIGADGLVRALPEGLDCVMSPSQVALLPQTHHQAIAVAICLAQPGPIYIFDQPTRGLPEAVTERVQAAITKKAKDGIVMLITNDADEMRLGTRLIMLDRGRVVVNERAGRGRDKALKLMTPPMVAA